MQAKLTVVGGKATKGALSVNLPAVIGRSEDAGLTIAHRTISRHHAELFESGGQVMIRDLGSVNGTFVNGESVKESPLPSGSQFSIGPLTFRVEYDHQDGQARLPAAPPAKVAAPAKAEREKAAAKPVPGPSPEVPDFESLDDDLLDQATVSANEANRKDSPEKPSTTGDPFEDLLNDLG